MTKKDIENVKALIKALRDVSAIKDKGRVTPQGQLADIALHNNKEFISNVEKEKR